MAGRLVRLLAAAKVDATVLMTGGLAADSGLKAAVQETLVQAEQGLRRAGPRGLDPRRRDRRRAVGLVPPPSCSRSEATSLAAEGAALP